MSKEIFKNSFTEYGELYDSPEYGLIIKLPFGNLLKRVLKHLIGIDLEVSWKPLKYQRSNAQNKWLWGVAYTTISAWHKKNTGEDLDKDAIHAFVLQEILEYKIVSAIVQGREVLYVQGKSTSRLNTKEFCVMKERLQAYYAELDCIIPDPRKNNFLSDYRKPNNQ